MNTQPQTGLFAKAATLAKTVKGDTPDRFLIDAVVDGKDASPIWLESELDAVAHIIEHAANDDLTEIYATRINVGEGTARDITEDVVTAAWEITEQQIQAGSREFMPVLFDLWGFKLTDTSDDDWGLYGRGARL